MHPPWNAILREAVVSGSLASLFSTAALLAAGRRQAPSPAAPTNATSQWLWGQREALQADHPDLRHTAVGYATHHVASTMWAVLHALLLGERPVAAQPLPALGAAAATSAFAAFVDFELTPERFTPGFQHRVSTPALVGVYACFALGLAAGSLAVRRSRTH